MIDRAPIRARFTAVSSGGAGACWRRPKRERQANGGIAAVSAATGMAASTIGHGLKELDEAPLLTPGRVRRLGGGCKPLTETDPHLVPDLLKLVEPDERGEPMSPLRWNCKSLRHLAAELNRLGNRVSHTVVGELPKAAKFSLQGNR